MPGDLIDGAVCQIYQQNNGVAFKKNPTIEKHEKKQFQVFWGDPKMDLCHGICTYVYMELYGR